MFIIYDTQTSKIVREDAEWRICKILTSESDDQVQSNQPMYENIRQFIDSSIAGTLT